jgi:serine/threonine-protein kinase RsbT
LISPVPHTAVPLETGLLERHRKVRTQRVTLPVHSDEDVVGLRKQVRERAVAIGLSLVDQTKLVTAASELARNTLKYGGGGEAHVDSLRDGFHHGIGLIFVDRGPGIGNVDEALRDGYTTGGGLGLGLGGAKRLVDEFDIESRLKEGTAVSVVKWKR